MLKTSWSGIRALRGRRSQEGNSLELCFLLWTSVFYLASRWWKGARSQESQSRLDSPNDYMSLQLDYAFCKQKSDFDCSPLWEHHTQASFSPAPQPAKITMWCFCKEKGFIFFGGLTPTRESGSRWECSSWLDKSNKVHNLAALSISGIYEIRHAKH